MIEPTATHLTAFGALRKQGRQSERILRAEWRAVDALKRKAEQPIRAQARRLFREQERVVLARLPAILTPILLSDQPGEVFKNPFIVSVLFDIGRWIRETAERLAEPILAAMEAGFLAGLDRISVSGPEWIRYSPRVQQTLQDVLTRQLEVPVTTARQLSREIQEGLSNAESLPQITLRVKGVFKEAKTKRAETIATTAATAAYEAEQLRAFQEAGVPVKRFLSQRDRRVRKSHEIADSQEVPVDMPFTVGGYLMMHPGDSSMGAPAKETISCRCSILPVIRD